MAWITENILIRLAHKELDIYKISHLLGHEDVQTTQKRYAHHCTESLRIGAEILDSDYVCQK